MKKYFFAILLFLQSVTAANCQTTYSHTLVYNVSDFDLTTEFGMTNISSSIHHLTLNEDTLQPALPYIGVFVAIGDNEHFDTVSVIKTETLLASNITMAPNQEVVTTDVLLSRDTRSIPNYSESEYPFCQVQYTGTHITGGYKFLTFRVCPFRYAVTERKIYLATSLTLNISLTSGSNRLNNPTPIYGSLAYEMLKDIVVNEQDIPTAGIQPIPALEDVNTYQYVIITNNALKPIYQKLAQWKTHKGVKATIRTVETIAANDTANIPLFQKIKKEIRRLYNGGYGQHLKYVLLGGDLSVVPTVMGYIHYSEYSKTVPTDFYYSNLSDLNWDSNNNSIYGEIDDLNEVKPAPNLILSRIPLSDSLETNNLITKIIQYESDPLTCENSRKILLAGRKISYFTELNGRTVSDVEKNNFFFFRDYVSPYWNGEKVDLFDPIEKPDSGFTIDNLIAEINKGYLFINIDTHGSPRKWLLRPKNGDSLYYYYHAAIQNNKYNSIITTIACQTNGFHENNCLSTAFLKNANSGILAYWGSSDFGWSGHSNTMKNIFYKSLLCSKYHRLGYANNQAKLYFKAFCDYYGPGRWLLFSVNLLGDPEMPIFTEIPKHFTNTTTEISNNKLILDTGKDSTDIYYTYNIGQNNYEIFKHDIRTDTLTYYSSCSISLTNTNYVPLSITISNNSYLQNKSFWGDNIIKSNNIFVGSNVTSSQEIGNVTIYNGYTEMQANNEVIITSGFEVKKGATLEIQ